VVLGQERKSLVPVVKEEEEEEEEEG